jgi:hypothetical protein
MPTSEHDDVARLMSATGASKSSYREFDNSGGNSTSAPLIDAVFAKVPPHVAPAEQLAGVLPKADLVADVFDQPKAAEAPVRPVTGAALERPVQSPPAPPIPAYTPQQHQAPQQHQNSEPRRLPPSFSGSGRSLSDIRRIVAMPSDEVVVAPPNESLHGLFDRLAQ